MSTSSQRGLFGPTDHVSTEPSAVPSDRNQLQDDCAFGGVQYLILRLGQIEPVAVRSLENNSRGRDARAVSWMVRAQLEPDSSAGLPAGWWDCSPISRLEPQPGVVPLHARQGVGGPPGQVAGGSRGGLPPGPCRGRGRCSARRFRACGGRRWRRARWSAGRRCTQCRLEGRRRLP